MKLKELVEGLDIIEVQGNPEVEITDIAYDSRKVKKGSLFVCIDGYTTDGHRFIGDALKNGAAALLVQKPVEDIPEDIAVVRTGNTRFGLAFVSDAFFGHPSRKFQLVGVTGTKGKTTATYMIKSILEVQRQKVGLIGTVANMIGSQVLYADKTTPESYDLQSLFSDMHSYGVDSVIMEVSSQGLALDRVSRCNYDIGVFTNLYKDHIAPREHQSMKEYLDAKIRLFTMCKKGLVNIDSPYSPKVIEGAKCEVLTYGIENKADIMARDIVKSPTSVRFTAVTPWFEDEIVVNIPGKFSVYNALAAIGTCGLMGIPYEAIRDGLSVAQVPGRVEIIHTGKDFTLIIDYAHNADSLEIILKTVKEFAPGRVVSLFGCGGNRDKGRRFGMGEVSGKFADFTIITSDNPRTEDPQAIIDDIEMGIKKTDGAYIKIIDRTEAIRYAIVNAKPGDVIVLAGKGHETYQIFKDKTIHYDEREIVRDILNELKAEN